MRQRRLAQISIFENYSQHEYGQQLKRLSDYLDQNPDLQEMLEDDLIDYTKNHVGRLGLTVENIFRCLLLKQSLQVSYRQLAFLLSDSMTYRSFARLASDIFPSKTGIQSCIRQIKPKTLELIFERLVFSLFQKDELDLRTLRIDSTVVETNITSPMDSQLLNDCIRVSSRHLAKVRQETGIKVFFTDKRKASRALS